MAQLTAEQFKEIPEYLQADYEQDGDGYIHREVGKNRALKSSMNDLNGKLKSMDELFKSAEAKAAEERAKAEQAALDKLKKEGKVDEILADYEKRANETKAQYEARIEKMSNSIKAKERSLVLNDLAGELKIFPDSAKMFAKLVQDRIDVDPETGKITYLDDAGGATSLDKAGFIAELAKDTGFDRMRQADVSQGGKANGSTSGGGASTPSGNLGGSKQERIAAINKKFNL